MALGMQDIFELKCLIRNIDIKLCARIESDEKQLLALVTRNRDVILHYSYGEFPIVLKRIQWFVTNNKNIQALCFDPTATWLLIICSDSSLHIVPFLSLVDRKQKVDCKWSISDLTHFFKPPQSPDCKPTSLVWWQTLDSNQNALVGYENGVIVLISLTDGRLISTCTVNETITELNLRHDNNLDACFLLINGISGHQWKLVLEQYPIGYVWPPELVNQSDETVQTRSHSWRQMGVDILISLMQRLVEKKNSKRDSASDTTSEASILSDSSHSGPELLPQFSNTFFSTQYVGDRHLFSAFYKPASVLTVHIVNSESEPLCKYKLPPNITEPLLNGKLIFTVNNERNLIQIVSSHLSDSKKDDDEFNPDSLIAQFSFENEKILKIFRLTDFAATKVKKCNEDKLFEMPKSIDDLHLKRTRVDTCLIVTMTAVYKVHIRVAPVKRFIHYIIDESDYERAEKIAHIFGLNTHQLLENCGDLFISRASYHSGIILYKQARTHLLKRVLKLALSADCKTLLKFINLCLNAGKVDMSVATKIHTGNLALMAYTELILRYGNSSRVSNIKDFMHFLRYEELYDQILAVNVACQAAQWKIVNVLAKTRGLLPEAVAAFGQILQSARAPRPTDEDFIYCISEPSLTQSLLLAPKSAEVIFRYIKTHVKIFPEDILRRFLLQLDPSQPSAIPLVSKLSRHQKLPSYSDSISDSSESESYNGDISIVRNLIETFIIVLVHLISKSDQFTYNLSYLKRVKGPDETHQDKLLDQFPDFQTLSCGYDHAAIVRNDMAFTMGVSNLGSLGVGPVLSQSSPPRLVNTLANLRVKVISVSCGRKHTLFLTDYGVYACGSNNYSQLGLGPNIQESPYPQMITDLSDVKIMQVVCGQYHSIALSADGYVYTWGWGIHGQLGHDSCNSEVYPRKLNFGKRIKQVAAGHAHSLILTEEGELYGFGSNAFGQLEISDKNSNKHTKPVRIHIRSDLLTPVEKVTSAYFHNVAVLQDQEVYTWGASPQEVRLVQSKHLKKGNGICAKVSENWRSAVNIYSGSDRGPIEQISVGYRHTAILHQGRILWGKNKDDELSPPHLQEQDILLNMQNYRFLHVSCGLDYTMAVDHMGRLLAWGSISMAQTLLGRSMNDSNEMKSNDCFLSANGGRRIFKVPSNIQGSSDLLPIEVPRIPSVTITFNPTDHNTILSKKFIPYSIIKIENRDASIQKVAENDFPFKDIRFAPKYILGQKTLQYVLETYYGLYDYDNILQVCLQEENYVAASRIAFIGGHYCDSLSFQLKAFKIHMGAYKTELEAFAKEYEMSSQNEHQKNYIEALKNINMINEKSDISQSNSFEPNSDTPIQLSSSSSLDSIRLWEEQEHQGGCESPCETGEADYRYTLSQLVQSLRNNHINQPISSVSKMMCESENDKEEFEIDNINIKNIVQMACQIIEFYLERISSTDNPILMQNILMLVIDFWLSSLLPVQLLEKVLLKNIEKYFYPLSIILFCKNFSSDSGDQISSGVEQKNSARFLKEFSTKFCLQLCLMVVENVNKT
ncbi:uncharacterized protein LOC123312995 [Coccinella septempunctata]|uniref:uncharacterized protein LOC123312995 n=1 Tax=Coccinella septempunctata TaxID=41139 RepID=UPI001D09871F|nr:uncharacterized protein LOC123312995 [Coccinella septempunctata]